MEESFHWEGGPLSLGWRWGLPADKALEPLKGAEANRQILTECPSGKNFLKAKAGTPGAKLSGAQTEPYTEKARDEPGKVLMLT